MPNLVLANLEVGMRVIFDVAAGISANLNEQDIEEKCTEQKTTARKKNDGNDGEVIWRCIRAYTLCDAACDVMLRILQYNAYESTETWFLFVFSVLRVVLIFKFG